jgi:hypothetical protein
VARRMILRVRMFVSFVTFGSHAIYLTPVTLTMRYFDVLTAVGTKTTTHVDVILLIWYGNKYF